MLLWCKSSVSDRGRGLGNDIVVKVLADHVTADIRNAISVQWSVEHRCCVFYPLLPCLLPTFFLFFIMTAISGHCVHCLFLLMKSVVCCWTAICMHACLWVCVCNGLVGVILGDGQAPIGRDLKRQAPFFFKPSPPAEQRLGLDVQAKLWLTCTPCCLLLCLPQTQLGKKLLGHGTHIL